MSVKVRFVGSLRSFSDEEIVELELLRPLPLKEVMKRITKKKPKLRSSLDISAPEKLRTTLLILVNGREISVLEGQETIINNGDKLIFVPILHGG